jgi:hypothetical protein
MINKINFYSLEQFILSDAQNLQSHLFDYNEQVISSLLGAENNGALSRITRKSYSSSTETLVLNDFRCVLQGKILRQTSDIAIDFSSMDTLANLYYTANQNAMTDFQDVNLYARVADESTANETRNFWSPINQASIQQDVDTRTVQTMDIKAALSTPSAVGSYEYKKIGSIKADGWLVSVDINTGQNRVTPQTITTNYLFNNYFASIRIADLISNGLRGPFFALESALDNILKNGLNDPAATDNSPLVGGQPTLSLQGLAAFVGNNIHKVRARIHLSATANNNWPANTEVDFDNLTTVAPYTELFPIAIGGAQPNSFGFNGTVVNHSFDSALWALPFDKSEVLDATGGAGLAADTNMLLIVQDLDNPIDGPDGEDINVNTTFGYHLKQGFNNLWGFTGTMALGGPVDYLNVGGGLAWNTSANSQTAITFWTNLTQNKAENNRYEEMIKSHFINYNGSVIDGYTSDSPPQPIIRNTPTYINLPTIKFICTIKN